VLVFAPAIFTVPCPVFFFIPEILKGAEIGVSEENNVTPLTAVTTVWASKWNKFLPTLL